MGQCSSESDDARWVGYAEVLTVRECITLGLSKLCSDVGFEQRCIVRREEHSQKMFLKKSGKFVSNIAISILGLGNTV